MNVFKLALIVLSIPWIISGMRYILNTDNNTAIIIVSIVVLLLITVFIYIPKLFDKFNDLNKTDFNFFKLNTMVNFLKNNSSLPPSEAINKLVNPYISLVLNGNKIMIEINQNIKMLDTILVFTLKNNEDNHLIIIKPSENGFIKDTMQLSHPDNQSLQGLFDNIKKCKSVKSKAYVLNNEMDCYFVHSVIIEHDGHSKISIKMIESLQMSLPLPIRNAITEGDSKIASNISRKDYEYLIKK
ncbi:hypothetical protein ABGT24_00170 [Peribacillus frigoritolerans]|uniref:hypothetical protein n=1 Tax=Peribacillus frigoritolerans TaxID=450367 RepID=UPI00345D9505